MEEKKENKIKIKDSYKSILNIFLSFYFMVFLCIIVMSKTDIIYVLDLAVQNRKYLFLSVFSIFSLFLLAPLRYIMKKGLNKISKQLFYNKSEKEKKSYFMVKVLFMFLISNIILTLCIFYYLYYAYIINILDNVTRTNVIFFIFMNILMVCSFEFTQVEKLLKIFLSDFFKLDLFKLKSIKKIENKNKKEFSDIKFRQYGAKEIFIPDFIPKNNKKENIEIALNKIEEVDREAREDYRLTLDKDSIVKEHNLMKNSNLIYTVILYRKSTLSELDKNKEKLVSMIKDDKVMSKFRNNIEEVNNFLKRKNNKTRLNLKTRFDPKEKVKHKLRMEDIFKNKIKESDEYVLLLLNNHRHYLRELVIRS